MSERYIPQEGDIVHATDWGDGISMTVDKVSTSGKAFIGVFPGGAELSYPRYTLDWVKVGPKPVLRERWINIAPHSLGTERTRNDADLYAGDFRIAVLHLFPDGTTKIDWLDGNGEV